MRLRSLAAAALAAALTLPSPMTAAPAAAQDLGALLGLFGGGGAIGPLALSPEIYGRPTPVQLWISPSPGPQGWTQVDGRVRTENFRATIERGLTQALVKETRGHLRIEGVRLTSLSLEPGAFRGEGEIRHAPASGGRERRTPFEARIPYVVAPEGLKLRPELRLGEAPAALRAAAGRLAQPLDLVALENMRGARLVSFAPSLDAAGVLDARARFLASPEALSAFMALALGGAGGR